MVFVHVDVGHSEGFVRTVKEVNLVWNGHLLMLTYSRRTSASASVNAKMSLGVGIVVVSK